MLSYISAYVALRWIHRRHEGEEVRRLRGLEEVERREVRLESGPYPVTSVERVYDGGLVVSGAIGGAAGWTVWETQAREFDPGIPTAGSAIAILSGSVHRDHLIAQARRSKPYILAVMERMVLAAASDAHDLVRSPLFIG